MKRFNAYLPLIVFACTLAASTIYLTTLHDRFVETGFPLDDAWIHATYARNFSEHGEFAFNAGEPSTGTTSLFWTLALAAAHSISGDVVTGALVLGILSLWFCTHFFFRFVQQTMESDGIAFLSAILFLLSGVVLWWSLSGMETTLFLGVALAAWDSHARHRHVLSGIFCGVLILLRPEGIILGLILSFLLFRRKGDRRTLSLFASSLILGVLAYIVWNYSITGSLWTSTLAGRRWLARSSTAVSFSPIDIVSHAASIAFRWLRMVVLGINFFDSMVSSALLGTLAGIFLGYAGKLPLLTEKATRLLFDGITLVIAAVGFILIIAPEVFPVVKVSSSTFSTERIHVAGVGTLLMALTSRVVLWVSDQPLPNRIPAEWKYFFVWIIAHNLAYAVFIPYPGHAGRYQPMNIALPIMLIALSLREAELPLTRIDTAIRFSVITLTLWIGAISFSSWRDAYVDGVHHINRTHVATSRWIERELPEKAVVAAFDIGALGYFSGRRIVDIGSLIDNASLPYLEKQDIDAFLERRRPTHVAMIHLFSEEHEVEPLSERMGFGRQNLFSLHPIYEARFDSTIWKNANRIAGNAYPIVRVSELRYKGSISDSMRKQVNSP